jgi:hypothetical protein
VDLPDQFLSRPAKRGRFDLRRHCEVIVRQPIAAHVVVVSSQQEVKMSGVGGQLLQRLIQDRFRISRAMSKASIVGEAVEGAAATRSFALIASCSGKPLREDCVIEFVAVGPVVLIRVDRG